MVVTEFMNNSSLESYLRKLGDEDPTKIDWQLLMDICLDIALVLIHLNSLSEPISHGDLAARNILLHREADGQITAKLADFGLAIKGTGSSSIIPNSASIHPYPWSAPEVFEGIRTTKSDIYSFATVIWEVFSLGKQPWINCSLEEVKRNVSAPNGRRLEKPRNMPDRVYELLKQCWEPERHKRPEISEVRRILENERQYLRTVEPIQNSFYANVNSASSTEYLPPYASNYSYISNSNQPTQNPNYTGNSYVNMTTIQGQNIPTKINDQYHNMNQIQSTTNQSNSAPSVTNQTNSVNYSPPTPNSTAIPQSVQTTAQIKSNRSSPKKSSRSQKMKKLSSVRAENEFTKKKSLFGSKK